MRQHFFVHQTSHSENRHEDIRKDYGSCRNSDFGDRVCGHFVRCGRRLLRAGHLLWLALLLTA